MEPVAFNYPNWLSLRLIRIRGKDSGIFPVGGPRASVFQFGRSLMVVFSLYGQNSVFVLS